MLFERVLGSFVRLPVFNRVQDVYHQGRGLNHSDGGGVSRKSRMVNPPLKHVSYDRDKLALKPFYSETVLTEGPTFVQHPGLSGSLHHVYRILSRTVSDISQLIVQILDTLRF